MKYMLIIYIILNPSTESEPNFKFGSDSKCILNKNYNESDIET